MKLIGVSKPLIIAIAVVVVVVIGFLVYYTSIPPAPQAPYKITIYTG